MNGRGVEGNERWAALEIRLLTAFVAVVEEGSFTGAARQLGYTQSGISQQIAALERIVERKLLTRQFGRGRAIELTHAGTTLLEHARTVLRQLDRAYVAIVDVESAAASAVKVGAFSSAAVHLLPGLRRELRREDSLSLEWVEVQTVHELFAHLDAGTAELAFAVLPAPERFAVERVGTDPYVAVVSADSPLAASPALALEELKGKVLIGITRCDHEDAVAAELAGYGVDVSAFERYDDNRLIQSLVASGSGVAIVPSLVVDANDEAVRVLEIPVDLPPRTIALIHPRDAELSQAAVRFKQLALPLSAALLRRATAAARSRRDSEPRALRGRTGRLSAA
jgi:DNA-binding transcriptional LysR family regulator